MTRRPEAERFSQIIFYGTVLLIGYLAWRIVQPFLAEIGWAVVLAICLEPLRVRVQPRLGRTRTAALLTVLVLVLIVLPVLFVGAAVVSQGGPAVAYVDAQLRSQGGPAGWFHAGWTWLRARASFLPSEQDVVGQITASLGRLAQFLAGQAGGLLASAVGLVFALVITMAVLFFLLRDASKFADALRRALPFGTEQNARLLRIAHDLVFASVTATIAVAAIQGVIGGVTFAALGIQGAALWGVIIFLLAFLPVVGATLVWLPAAGWLVLSGSLAKGIILALVGLGILGQVDNVVRPLLLSGKSQMSTLVLIISLMGGVAAFGFIGVVLGPLVAALVTALFDSYEEVIPAPTADAPATAGAPATTHAGATAAAEEPKKA
jgi:predicted PurR-regulated permease PerM